MGKARKLDVLEQSPFWLAERLISRIEAETEAAKAGQPARIRAKLNALTDPGMIQALYRASQAGVSIDLVVRGACRLRPGLPGISENIRVRSILGRFLEHHRVYCFHAAGEDVVYIGSADWMERNFFRRVEVELPIVDAELKARLLNEGLDVYWQDNVQAWDLGGDGRYTRVVTQGPPLIAQVELLERLTDYVKVNA
jgi:polyphosphate kinase